MLTTDWLKSSRSYSNGNCVQARWRKSSRCQGQIGGDCVEARSHAGHVQVRDSKLGEASPLLKISPAAWSAFLVTIKDAQ